MCAAAGNATYTAYSLAPKNMAIYGTVQNVTTEVEAEARGALAAGRLVQRPACLGFKIQIGMLWQTWTFA